ncbi:putative leucine-rich repeat domain, L domain-containing protein [Rosa chinensis]|uniref:Putative leucine-rich repeat domain, L domain-containing protein n=2 Tax=Rosa chinensis TaxID=74649 RepID=A0A2P6QEJ2_ROSCH|nr:putative leucine-rich repeat domain, L domain-containing protein [Rosa chinensis]
MRLDNPNLSLLIGNLSELMELRLDGVDISSQKNSWCQAISTSLPKLRVLSLSSCTLSGPIDSSLRKLHSLSLIHIEYNHLSSPVPEFFSNFTNLTSLRFGNSGLHGTFPNKIFQLPRLQTIHLWGNPQLQGSLPEFPKNGLIQSLVLSGSNFSGLLPYSIGVLTMLSQLDVSYCNFTGPIPKSVENLAGLVYLDLSGNKFNGSVPFFRMAKNLTQINLSKNYLTGQINSTHWEHLTNLLILDLHSNLLDGSFPFSLFLLPSLEKILLSNNQFSGQLLEVPNISSYILDTLDLSSNNLEGPVPRSLFNLQGLKILSLSSNNFSGLLCLNDLQQLRNLSSVDLSHNSLLITYEHHTNSSYSSFPQLTPLLLASGELRTFPEFLRNQSELAYLDLSENQIFGQIPNWIWRLNLLQLNLSCNSLVTLEGPMLNLSSRLFVLDLHSNQLQGQIPVFSSPAYYYNIQYLDYSRNNFSSSIPADIGNILNYTRFFSISNNNIHGSIPGSICNAFYLQVLDLSNNSLSAMIPPCLTAMSSNLAVLNLGTNSLTGTISDTFCPDCGLKTLDLNGNQIVGQFPESLGNCRLLEVLNLGNNQITGTFPNLLSEMLILRVLVLRSNKFYGEIGCPKTYGSWPLLQIVDIAHNNFSGTIPGKCMRSWRAMMANDSLSKLKHLQFEVFTQVYYDDAITVTNKGLEMKLEKILTIFTSIDFSGNKFSGSIPEEVGELKSLYVLNLSSNALTGEVPSSLGDLQHIESLDLSSNKLTGNIPLQLAKLTFLAVLNLSNNQLVGRIPSSTQISTFSADSFTGNKALCGFPLNVPCSNTNETTKFQYHKSGIGSVVDLNVIGTVEIGCIVGFGIATGSLVFCNRWRKWYYRAMCNIILKIFPQLDHRFGPHRRHVYINPRWGR